jgi:hypothetical protein
MGSQATTNPQDSLLDVGWCSIGDLMIRPREFIQAIWPLL